MKNCILCVVPVLLLPLAALSRSAAEGVFTKAQADRGQAVYGEECAKCHGQNLSGADGSPELAGRDFMGRWNKKPVASLYTFIQKTMPTDDPGHLSSRQYADLTAYILSANGLPAGTAELANDATKLNDITIEAKP